MEVLENLYTMDVKSDLVLQLEKLLHTSLEEWKNSLLPTFQFSG
jgi:hypothetical protein